MGTNIENVFFARSLVEQGLVPKNALLVDLGAQEFNGGIDIFKLRDVLAEFLPADTLETQTIADFTRFRYSGPIFELLGFKYLALDVYEGESNVVFDLNRDSVPEHLKGAAHLVQNFGTTEHILNQLNCFEVIHELASPDGGIMWHNLPMSDFHYHGFFKYDVKFFERLLTANNYEIVHLRFDQGPGSHVVPQVLFDHGLPRIEALDTAVNIVLRRTSPAPFQIPLDYDDDKVNVQIEAQQQAAGS
jgi:hypothetical protein